MILSSVNRLFWPIILYCIYIAVGPLGYYEMADGHYGIVFVWGIWLNGTFINSSMTYLYGAFQFLMCELPLISLYSKCALKRYNQLMEIPNQKESCFLCRRRRMTKIAFYVIIIIECILTICFAIVNGVVSIFTSVTRTWCLTMHIYFWILSRYLTKSALRLRNSFSLICIR